MDVKFISVPRDMVDTVPIVDGQVIGCKDNDDWFYDMNLTRYHLGDNLWLDIDENIYEAGFMINDGTIGVIQFVPNGGTDVNPQGNEDKYVNYIIGTVGESVDITEMPVTEREGYTFLGWYEDSNLQGNVVESLPDTFTSGKIMYHASWKEVQ